jgi:hypothetical protein
MPNKIKRTISIAPESDYEIHRLAKLWNVPVAQARERCYHYAAGGLEDGVKLETIQKIADIRQAEAKVEMLKASG